MKIRNDQLCMAKKLKHYLKKFRIEDLILTLIAAIAFVYCSDFPVLGKGSFWVNRKDSIWFATGCSIVAAYIFYVIQVVIPQGIKEKKAYTILKQRIEDFVGGMYELYVFCTDICKIDEANNRIIVPTNYVLRKENGAFSPWVERYSLEDISKRLQKIKEKLLCDENYKLLNKGILLDIQPLMDVNFPKEFEESQKYSEYTFGDLISSYKKFVNVVLCSKDCFDMNLDIHFLPFTNKEKIDEFEGRVNSMNSSLFEDFPGGMLHMKVSIDELEKEISKEELKKV